MFGTKQESLWWCHTLQQDLHAFLLPAEGSVVQGYPPVLVLLQQPVSSGCGQFVNDHHVPPLYCKEHRLGIPAKRTHIYREERERETSDS